MVLTIGHSNRTSEAFLDLLRAHSVQQLLDIRTIPRSRYNPQFNHEILPVALAASGIAYSHVGALGGLRHPRPNSANTGWRNRSFRGYADYMETPEFQAGLDVLMQEAAVRQVAIMCAEAVPWRCHRSLVADALVVRGLAVAHIMSATRAEPHSLTAFAKVDGTRLSYPSLAKVVL